MLFYAINTVLDLNCFEKETDRNFNTLLMQALVHTQLLFSRKNK